MASSRLEPRWPVGPAAALAVVALGVGFALTRPKPAPALAEIAPPAKIDAAPTGALPPQVFGRLHVPALLPAPAAAQEFAPELLAHFATAANFYRKGQFPQGDAAAAAVSDPIARAGLDWMALRVSPTPARLDAFAKTYADWPVSAWMRAVREGWLFTGKPTPTETLAALVGKPPVSAQGRIALARAELALGKRDEARAQFRAAATMDLTPTERTELAAQRV